MSEQSARKSKADHVLSATIATHKDNLSKLNTISKLDEHVSTLRSSTLNENDVVVMINMCKQHLEKSHDIVNINLPKINSDTKEITNAIKRINPSDYPGIANSENLFPQLAVPFRTNRVKG